MVFIGYIFYDIKCIYSKWYSFFNYFFFELFSRFLKIVLI